jgi:hypothetical protein
MPDSSFYLGRSDTQPATPVGYDPDDLTTHAVIVGMTGSGKTGLMINLLEEAAMRGLPSIVIDPKGDLTNLLLHFPDQLAANFEPWVDPEAARRANQSIPQLAEATAARWQDGLKEWGLGHDQLSTLSQAVDYVVYTPGSTAGVPVNLLASFAPPNGLNWEDHREALRERISSTVTALLGLIGIKDIDPLRSREHILLSNILESAWSKGAGLDLTELILQAQNPPFERLGAFPINTFFPEKDRFDLALLLNNFLAAPTFQAWVEGQPLDGDAFLFTPQGKPRMSIFYLAHLEETERMFFVTLLLASIESWMRAQRGSPGLRAILAFDEIVGYLPPVANPPSRPVLLRMLKQARAFGLGLILATQNPVDLDYKGLSNAGTWMIGRLQTDQDKQRLLDGLQAIEGGVDRATYDQRISGLRPRVFLLHNIHSGTSAQVFQTRWSLNYLAGPLSRVQLSGLKALGSAPDTGLQTPPLTAVAPLAAQVSRPPASTASAANGANVVSTEAAAPPSPYQSGSLTPPAAPEGFHAFFLPPALSIGQALTQLGGSFSGPARPEGILYKPALLFQVNVRYYNRRYGLDSNRRLASLVTGGANGRIDWDSFAYTPLDPNRLDTQPLPDSRFVPLPGWLSSAKGISAAQKDYIDYIYRSASIRILANDTLKVYSTPDDTQGSFRQKCDAVARQLLRSESDKAGASFDTKLENLQRKIERQRLIVDKSQEETSQRRMEQLGANAELVFSVFSKRKRSLSSTMAKGRMASQARADLQADENNLAALEDEFRSLQQDKDNALKEIQERWARSVGDISEVPIAVQRKDIYLEIAGIAWLPVYIIQAQGQRIEAPAT